MKNAKRLMLLTLAMTMGLSINAYADEEGFREIGDVHLDVYSAYNGSDEPPTVEVTTSDEGYEITDVIVTNDSVEWSTSISPRVEIYLTTVDDYSFKYGNKSHVKFTGDTVKLLGIKKSSDDTELEIKIDIKPEGTDLGTPSSLQWVNGTTGKWLAGYGARRYEIDLYKGIERKFVGDTDILEYDFSSAIKEPGTYKFKVRSLDSKGKASAWNESYETYVGIKDNTQTQDGWLQDQVGWWYRNADGSYTRNDWQLIDGKWYHFNEVGYMNTGWVFVKDQWYYLDPSGAMTTGWQLVNGKWYFMKDNGQMAANEAVGNYIVGPDGAWIE